MSVLKFEFVEADVLPLVPLLPVVTGFEEAAGVGDEVTTVLFEENSPVNPLTRKNIKAANKNSATIAPIPAMINGFFSSTPSI